MEERKIRVAIPQGDTNGIGYELIFKTFEQPEMLELFTPIIYGSPKIAAYHRKALDIQTNFSIINNASEARDGRLNLLTVFDDEVKVELGVSSPEAGMAALKAFDRAMTDFRDNAFDVLVCPPINRCNMTFEGYEFTCIADYLTTCLGADKKDALVMLLGDNMRVAGVTRNVPLKNVASTLSQQRIVKQLTTLNTTLRRDFNISIPRLAVLALNPKSGEELGMEETDILMPSIQEVNENGINAFGPYQSDTFFGAGTYDAFDAVLAMYHDQGSTPFRTLNDVIGVKFVAGLPMICTYPDQGTEYDRAGLGTADPTAFRNAIYMAVDIFRNRQRYDEGLANPLPKLYHEKRDESEKVRFSINKKGENKPREGQRGQQEQAPREASAAAPAEE